MKIRVLVADDHTILRRGVRRIIDSEEGMEVVGEAASGAEALARIGDLNPDVAVVDNDMADMNGIAAATAIHRRSPAVGILILGTCHEPAYVARSMQAGARAYLVKDSEESDLLLAIREVHRGGTFFHTSKFHTIAPTSSTSVPAGWNERYQALTERERQIYLLLAEARSNKQVAAVLGLSVHTIETHRLRLMEKLNLHSPAELVLSAARRGLIY